MVPIVCEALERLDLIVFLPITDQWQVAMEDDAFRHSEFFKAALTLLSVANAEERDRRRGTAASY